MNPVSDAGDREFAQETDLRPALKEDHHVGRGGAGNEIHEHPDGKEHEGLVDKIKQKVEGVLHKG